MPPVQATIQLPDEVWKAVQALAVVEGDTNTVIQRAVEEYLLRLHRQRDRGQPAKCKKLVDALSLPVSALGLSSRAINALAQMNIRYVCELVRLEPRVLLMQKNFGKRSLCVVQAKLHALGLSLGMKLDETTYMGAVLATVAARIAAAAE